MKGIIFNVVEEAVTADFGEAAWDQLLVSSGLDGGYSALGDYPSAELGRLVSTGAEVFATDPDDLTRHIGRAATGLLAARYPHFVEPHRHARDFLLTLNDVIHPEVRKLHANARPPQFDFEVLPDGGLRVGYRSTRGLCALADGMIVGAAIVFDEEGVVVHETCTRWGDDECWLRCSFSPVPTGLPPVGP